MKEPIYLRSYNSNEKYLLFILIEKGSFEGLFHLEDEITFIVLEEFYKEIIVKYDLPYDELLKSAKSISHLIFINGPKHKKVNSAISNLFGKEFTEEFYECDSPYDDIFECLVMRSDRNKNLKQWVIKKQLSINIIPGTATKEDIGELLSEISILYRMIGGSGINFKLDNIDTPKFASYE